MNGFERMQRAMQAFRKYLEAQERWIKAIEAATQARKEADDAYTALQAITQEK